MLNENDVPSGAILGLEAALRQPQVQHRGVLQKVACPGIGDIEVFGLTAQFERLPGRRRRARRRRSASTTPRSWGGSG